jgi:hypothetical protein
MTTSMQSSAVMCGMAPKSRGRRLAYLEPPTGLPLAVPHLDSGLTTGERLGNDPCLPGLAQGGPEVTAVAQGLWAQLDNGEVLLRLAMDLVSLVILTIVLYFRRYGRRDVVVTLVTFNVGLFAVLTVITSETVSAGVGFGLFAVLSIIRLRSETVSNVELGYFFLALALALVNGFETSITVIGVGLNVLLLVTIYIVDLPSLHTTVRRRSVLLDEVVTDSNAVRERLSNAFGLDIVSLAITDIDYVRETTRVLIRYIADPHLVAPTEQSAYEDLV